MNSEVRILDVEAYSIAALYVETYLGDQFISQTTGFLYKISDDFFLVSNWHVFSGRDANTGQPLDDHARIPNRVSIKLMQGDGRTLWYDHFFNLISPNDESLWLQHPLHGQSIDVAVLKISMPSDRAYLPINGIGENLDMKISVSNEVFVLGFPMGIRGGGSFPIWKKASIATEPCIPLDGLPKMLLDTATTSGMSGSPVVAFSTSTYQSTGKTLKIVVGGGCARKFLGIYSGRIRDRHSSLAAQLGVMWKREVIDEIIKGKTPGSHKLM